jgi:hypothetical protein
MFLFIIRVLFIGLGEFICIGCLGLILRVSELHESLSDKEVSKQFPQVGIIRLIVEPERAGIIQKDGKFVRQATTKRLGRSRHFLLHDAIVFLFLGGCLKALPRQRAAVEVHHHIPETLEVVATGLFDAKVRVDGRVPSGSSQILVLAIGNVQVRFRIAVFFRKTKVDDVDLVAALTYSHEEVVWLDVAMDERFCVDVFNSGDLV